MAHLTLDGIAGPRVWLRKASDTGWGPRGYSGATCTLAFCARGLLHCANVGDSRMVLGTFAEDQAEWVGRGWRQIFFPFA